MSGFREGSLEDAGGWVGPQRMTVLEGGRPPGLLLEAAASLSQACAALPSFLEDLGLVMETLFWTPSFLLCTVPPPHHCFFLGNSTSISENIRSLSSGPKNRVTWYMRGSMDTGQGK